jgi:hypothetical protein
LYNGARLRGREDQSERSRKFRSFLNTWTSKHVTSQDSDACDTLLAGPAMSSAGNEAAAEGGVAAAPSAAEGAAEGAGMDVANDA